MFCRYSFSELENPGGFRRQRISAADLHQAGPGSSHGVPGGDPETQPPGEDSQASSARQLKGARQALAVDARRVHKEGPQGRKGSITPLRCLNEGS